jgi:hypothetical protein
MTEGSGYKMPPLNEYYTIYITTIERIFTGMKESQLAHRDDKKKK